jgi:hypothetical protein
MCHLSLQRNIAYRGFLEYVVNARDACPPPSGTPHRLQSAQHVLSPNVLFILVPPLQLLRGGDHSLLPSYNLD